VLARPANDFVADFVGADRGLRRLAVTPLEAGDLDYPPVVTPATRHGEARRAVEARATNWAVVVDESGRLLGWVEPARVREGDETTVAASVRPLDARVKVGSSLRAVFAEMLQHDAGWVAVLDGDCYLGVITPDGLHAALRRSVGGEPAPAAPAQL
jgi:osmoprotectant transport system ATP-binding protein